MTREEAIEYWEGLRKTFSSQLEAELLFQVGYDNGWGLEEYVLEWLQRPAEEAGHER